MSEIEIILIMLCIVIFSNMLSGKIGWLSAPIIQIVLGIVYSLMPFTHGFQMETEMFVVLFVAPILFIEGKRFKSADLLKFGRVITFLILGLAILNIVICGYILHWLLGIPLPLAFALAAVLSPTDTVALKAISSRVSLPHSVETIAEGESLFGDASGLVAFNFAIIAQTTGIFSVPSMAANIFYVAIGSLALGIAFACLVKIINKTVKRLGIGEPAIYTVLQILTPFASFILAEFLGLSGILVVIICGKTMSIISPKLITYKEAESRFATERTWSTFLYVLNGFIFLLLGMELPNIFIQTTAQYNVFLSFGYVLLITSLLMVLRYIWAYLFIDRKSKLNALLLSFSGVRGALTLAACLSIPIMLPDSSPLILFVASGVIISTLILANISLPILSPKEQSRNYEDAKSVIKASISLIKTYDKDISTNTKDMLISYYEYLLRDFENQNKKEAKFDLPRTSEKSIKDVLRLGLDSENGEIGKLVNMEILDLYELEFVSLKIQKNVIKSMLDDGQITNTSAYKMFKALTLEEVLLLEDELENQEAHTEGQPRTP